jgi:hypothetical protein
VNVHITAGHAGIETNNRVEKEELSSNVGSRPEKMMMNLDILLLA